VSCLRSYFFLPTQVWYYLDYFFAFLSATTLDHSFTVTVQEPIRNCNGFARDTLGCRTGQEEAPAKEAQKPGSEALHDSLEIRRY